MSTTATTAEKSTPTYADQPVANVIWIHRDQLQANAWNPNHVAPPEMELLMKSIEEDGWTQPIVVQEIPADSELGQDLGLEATMYEVVDGFHRWTVSGKERIGKLTDFHVPVVVVTLDPAHARMSTIRHNRARGQHKVASMSDIVNDLRHHLDIDEDEIAKRLGMEGEEVDRFLARGNVVGVHGSGEFGQAWRAEQK